MALREKIPKPLHSLVRGAYRGISVATQSARTLPDFVMVGGQRCGTTSLFKNLAEHPQVLRPGIDKGTDYYTLHYDKGLDWYRSRFPVRQIGNLRTRSNGPASVFEACTYYMFHPFAIERMARDLPDAKVVVMLRNPVERAFSAYKHELARGFETESVFVRALELEPERLQGELEKMRLDATYESHPHRHQAYTARGHYAEQISRLWEHYPRDQVLVSFSEDYFAAPEQQYDRVRTFLGLRPFQPRAFDKVNARPSKPMPEQAHELLVHHYADHDAELAELLGRELPWSY